MEAEEEMQVSIESHCADVAGGDRCTIFTRDNGHSGRPKSGLLVGCLAPFYTSRAQNELSNDRTTGNAGMAPQKYQPRLLIQLKRKSH